MNKTNFNKNIKFFLSSILVLFFFSINYQSKIFAQNTELNKKECIVVLTYDDGLDVQLDNVVPVLDKYGFKGTFYVPGNASSLTNRLDEWRTVAKNGHELGNHTLFHPCFGKSMNRDWVNENYDLDIYSIDRFTDEILITNVLLKSIDGKSKRTFAYTCGDQVINGEHIWDKIEGDFLAARGVNRELVSPENVNVKEIGSFMVNMHSAEEMIEWVKEAIKHNALIVFLFHGVGGGHDINVDLSEHNKLVEFLKENEEDIWVAPLVDVAQYIRSIK